MVSSRKDRNSGLTYISVAFFTVILIYMFILIVQYANSDTITGYEVKTGSLSSDQIYTGIALRTEETVGSDYAGYVNYFNKDGDRLGVGQLAYTVDESGQVMDYLNSESADSTVLSSDDLSELQNDMVDFSSEFDPTRFSSTYDFKDSVLNSVQKLSGSYILKDINSLASSGLSDSIHQCYTTGTGIIVYYTDGYEDTTYDSLTEKDLSTSTISAYKKTSLDNNQLVATGDPIYKLCTDENWSLVIETTDDTAKKLVEEGYIKIRFIKNQQEIWASVSASRASGSEGMSFVKLDLSNSMVVFCTDRFLRVELITEDETGLKVPNSSIVNEKFFLVPKEYVTTGPGGTQGVLRETYDEKGTKSTEFIDAVPYSETDTDYYLDENTLSAGDVIDKPDSTDTFTLSAQDGLTGVYNINKGYADFRQITILYQNEEYSIVQSNTTYGLSEYDHIVLDASAVTPNTLVYG